MIFKDQRLVMRAQTKDFEGWWVGREICFVEARMPVMPGERKVLAGCFMAAESRVF